MEYEDFSIKVEPKRRDEQGDYFPIYVSKSPAGEGASKLRLPFDPKHAGDLLVALEETVRSGAATRSVAEGAMRTPPRRVGAQLFDSLFTNRVRTLFEQSIGMLYASGKGLRIKLHIDPEDPDLAVLASLPWEFLYRKETREFLNLNASTPLIRYLDVQRPYRVQNLRPPLRILVAIASPNDYDELDLERERDLIEESWARQEGVEVDFLKPATIDALQDRLRDRSYHVLHYMGHGDFDEVSGKGVLLLESALGTGHRLNGSALGNLLLRQRELGLVFINACNTARVTKERGLDPFAGVASAMVMAGVPAVVAMQFAITDRAAITFSRKFYRLLARGLAVDAAVSESRLSVQLHHADSMEWGTPVLFMRAPDGQLFQLDRHGRSGDAAEHNQPPPSEDMPQAAKSLQHSENEPPEPTESQLVSQEDRAPQTEQDSVSERTPDASGGGKPDASRVTDRTETPLSSRRAANGAGRSTRQTVNIIFGYIIGLTFIGGALLAIFDSDGWNAEIRTVAFLLFSIQGLAFVAWARAAQSRIGGLTGNVSILFVAALVVAYFLLAGYISKDSSGILAIWLEVTFWLIWLMLAGLWTQVRGRAK